MSYIIDTTCSNESFLSHVITERHNLLQIYRLLNLSFTHVAAFFETSVLKEVRILYLLSPQ